MADTGLIDADIGSLPAEIRPALKRIFRYVLSDLRFGHPSGETAQALKNFAGAFLTTTTPSTPGDEFSIAHGLGRTPYLLIPVLPLDAEGAQTVPLTVTRVADDKRIYLSSTVADAVVTLVVEG